MQKKYIVRLTDQERNELVEIVKRLKGTSQKVRRAQILLKADADGPNWTDERIGEAFSCRTKTVENIRQPLAALTQESPDAAPPATTAEKQLSASAQRDFCSMSFAVSLPSADPSARWRMKSKTRDS